jgi:hypothetical protein
MITTTDSYKDWTISVSADSNMCSNFSFDVTDPSGRTQHVAMGGDDERRAMERAKELIDLELALGSEE